jgi:hypothetical protein
MVKDGGTKIVESILANLALLNCKVEKNN